MPRAVTNDYLTSFRYGIRDTTPSTVDVFNRAKGTKFGRAWFAPGKALYVGAARIAGIEMASRPEEVAPLNSTIKIPYVISTEPGTLTLAKGVVVFDQDFADWFFSIVNGTPISFPVRRQLTVDVFGPSPTEVPGYIVKKSFVFHNCIPITYYTDDLDATAGEILVESLDINFSFMDVITPNLAEKSPIIPIRMLG